MFYCSTAGLLRTCESIAYVSQCIFSKHCVAGLEDSTNHSVTQPDKRIDGISHVSIVSLSSELMHIGCTSSDSRISKLHTITHMPTKWDLS